jgi:putative holliday junction resolvase
LGVAVGELELKLAHPLKTYSLDNSGGALALVDLVVKEWKPVILVVGLPRRENGSEHPLAKRCHRFARQLQSRFAVPTVMVDEAYTSTAAEELLRQSGTRWQTRQKQLDQVAAQQILETFFELASRTP